MVFGSWVFFIIIVYIMFENFNDYNDILRIMGNNKTYAN